MREATINVYKYNELSDKAKERVLDDFRSDPDLYAWHIDNRSSFIDFAKFLGGVAKFEVSLWGRSFAKVVDLDLEYAQEVILSNEDLINKCCPFTGYCMDEPLLDPVREYIKNPEDRLLHRVIQESCNAWVKAYEQDWHYCYSEEGILDIIDANEFEFTQEGKRWR